MVFIDNVVRLASPTFAQISVRSPFLRPIANKGNEIVSSVSHFSMRQSPLLV